MTCEVTPDLRKQKMLASHIREDGTKTTEGTSLQLEKHGMASSLPFIIHLFSNQSYVGTTREATTKPTR